MIQGPEVTQSAGSYEEDEFGGNGLVEGTRARDESGAYGTVNVSRPLVWAARARYKVRCIRKFG